MDGCQKFLLDRWERDAQDANAGYGITAVLEGGELLEKVALSSPRTHDGMCGTACIISVGAVNKGCWH